jgi:predicted RNA-binding protein with EMAP domain
MDKKKALEICKNIQGTLDSLAKKEVYISTNTVFGTPQVSASKLKKKLESIKEKYKLTEKDLNGITNKKD